MNNVITIKITPEEIEKHERLTQQNEQKIRNSLNIELKKEWLQYQELQDIEKFLNKIKADLAVKKSNDVTKLEIYRSLSTNLELFLIHNFFSEKRIVIYPNIEKLHKQLTSLRNKDLKVRDFIKILENLIHNNEVYRDTNSDFNGLISRIDARIISRFQKK